MTEEPQNLVLHHLRELRQLVEQRFETMAGDIESLRAEMRETRSALVGVGHLVHLLSGDMKVEFEAVRARLDRLERERA